MRIAIAGMGAIGGWIAARLLAAGEAPVALVTGRHLEPLARHGLRLRDGGTERSWPIRASASAAELGVQDLVVIACKATALAAMAPTLAPMVGPGTLILTAMNGVPWWFFHGLAADMAREPLQSVDPGGAISRALPPRQVIGGVVHIAASMPEPGVVVHDFGDRVIVGDPMARRPDGPTGSGSAPANDRSVPIAALFRAAGIDAPVAADIHREVWAKLWGNMTMNPVSALTGATMATILADGDARAFMAQAMIEAGVVGKRLGISVPMTPEERLEIASKLGHFKTSMLQDVEAGRPIELDSLVGAVTEIARRVAVPVPTIDALLGLARLQARERGLYPR
jgi:2-dehydropantoate 2-reductase